MEDWGESKSAPKRYPNDDGWGCPSCGKWHSHRHWKDSRNLNRKPWQKKWDNWEGKAAACMDSDPKYEYDDNGLPRPRFCPHCGFEEVRLILVRSK